MADRVASVTIMFVCGFGMKGVGWLLLIVMAGKDCVMLQSRRLGEKCWLLEDDFEGRKTIVLRDCEISVHFCHWDMFALGQGCLDDSSRMPLCLGDARLRILRLLLIYGQLKWNGSQPSEVLRSSP